MCTISMVGDYYGDRWKWVPTVFPQQPNVVIQPNTPMVPMVTREEFEQLKREVAEMKELLIAAKKIDEATGQPDCQMEEKLTVLRRVAELVGVSLDDVL